MTTEPDRTKTRYAGQLTLFGASIAVVVAAIPVSVYEQHSGGSLGATLFVTAIGLFALFGIGVAVTTAIQERSVIVACVCLIATLALVGITALCILILAYTTGAAVLTFG